MPRPLIAISLDTFDPEPLEQHLKQGQLPNIARLIDRGNYHRLVLADGYVQSSAWRSFSIGSTVDNHGCYFLKQWRPETGSIEGVRKDWLPIRPFWSHLHEAGKRLGMVDVPFVTPPGDDNFRGVYVSGWQGHYLETGEPIVARVERIDDIVAATSPGRRLLPDLVVHWANRRPADSVGVAIPGHGELRWPRGERHTSGRSGNHRARGWAVTSGLRLSPLYGQGPPSSRQLVPTIFESLGVPLPSELLAPGHLPIQKAAMLG